MDKTNNLHRRKQRRRSASRFAFVFATPIVQFLFYLNPKFQASSSFLCLYRPVCVGLVRKPHCWFSHEAAHILTASSAGFFLLALIICRCLMASSLALANSPAYKTATQTADKNKTDMRNSLSTMFTFSLQNPSFI